MYKSLRPLLFALPPEAIHAFALRALQWRARRGTANVYSAPFNLMGISFPNRVGLAAGFDKNGDGIDGLGALGFGFIEIGTITPKPQPGNPKPRLFRLVDEQALVNRMGFNNCGMEQALVNLRTRKYTGIVGVNIGKNATTPMAHAADDYLTGLAQFYPHADYLAINISSPNTAGLRELQSPEKLPALLEGLCHRADELSRTHRKHTPIVLKISPDNNDAQLTQICRRIADYPIDGVIATNTTECRDDVKTAAAQPGGISGKPLLARSHHAIALIRSHLPDTTAIIGVGGIMSGEDAQATIAAGADVVQLYTGIIYERAFVDSQGSSGNRDAIALPDSLRPGSSDG